MMKPKTLWLVGRVHGETNPRTGLVDDWEFMGIFSSRTAAFDVCTTRNDFVAPCTLDEFIPGEPTAFPGISWPILEREMAE